MLSFFKDYEKVNKPAEAPPATTPKAAPEDAGSPDPSTASFDDIKAYMDSKMEGLMEEVRKEMSKFTESQKAGPSDGSDNTSQAQENEKEDK